MKCPECGQWNRASMPHCMKCGAPLNIDGASRLQWKDTLKDNGPSTAYLRADEFGQMDAAPDARDQLAREMQDLNKRKQEGAEKQNRLRGKNDGESASEVVVTVEPPARSRRLRHDDVPMTAVRVQPPVGNDQARRKESEIWHRVRFMDENGLFSESRTYDPAPSGGYSQGTGSWYLAGPLGNQITPRTRRKHPFLILLIALALVVLGSGGYFGYRYIAEGIEPTYNKDAIVTASLQDDLPAHTILIPGEDGTTIYIRELHSSYVVVDGFVSIEIPDHTWYDNLEGALDETMDVTLTPFLKTASGKQTPLDLITYQISIPLSPIHLDSPESLRSTVSTTMKAIQLTVRPGSRVTVNGKDISDNVNAESGEIIYQAGVQPIGDNTFTFSVRSQYCRENTISVVLYRERQEIPLDLAVGTFGSTDSNVMKVSATTLAGATVDILTPFSDLDITSLNSTGKFSFNALFNQIGDNRITISSSVPGMKTSIVNYDVYYVPRPEIYTKSAWPLSAEGYSELLSNIQVRAKNNQVYVIKGIVQYEQFEKPQRVVIYTSEDGKSQPVLVENKTKMKWKVGTYYRIYADAYSTYNSMPFLIARYSYAK